jgi:hypothetical protein
MISGQLSRERAASTAFAPLHLPLGDAVGKDIELTRQFGQRVLSLDYGQSHFRLEGLCMVPASSFAH